MGRIADAAADDDVEHVDVFTNKVDDILDNLEDDDDRAVVLSWLLSPSMPDETVEFKLFAHGIRCSDTTIHRWRSYQARGLGRPWAA